MAALVVCLVVQMQMARLGVQLIFVVAEVDTQVM